MDYPAAHSMDTTWFAVDDQGHVALLDSYEAGAVPEVWNGAQDGAEILESLLRAGAAVDEAAFEADPSPGSRLLAPNDSADPIFDVLIHAAHPRVADRIHRARRLVTASGIYLWTPELLDQDELASLLRRGLIHRAWLFADLRPSWFGLFDYKHDQAYENTRSGPYVRQGSTPRSPLRLDMLSERLQRLAVHLPGVSFVHDDRIQPAELLPCNSHSLCWYDREGVEHVFERG